ncbi:MAG: hypothetical protein F9K18_08235, partial [Thermoanaerobaculia bacterium]
MKEIQRFEGQLAEIDRLVAEGDGALALRVPAISGWSVAQQIDHSLRVAEHTVGRVLARPEALPRGLTLVGRIVLGLGWFPRGSAKAPRGAEGRECSGAELAPRVAGM